MIMALHLEVETARARLEEAREWAAHRALVRSLAAPRQPLRVAVGLGLVRVGHWLAGMGDQAPADPSRATA
jgi:hypothetical protein